MGIFDRSLFSNPRFYILLFSGILAGIIYLYITTFFEVDTQIITLVDTYALIAVFFLYLTVLATPVTKLFPKFPFRGQFLNARRALGVSAFFFAFLHSQFATYGLLGGPEGMLKLPSEYQTYIFLGTIAFYILLILAVTSTEWAIEKLSFAKWKLMQRAVYVASVLILLHALQLGTHFHDGQGIISTISGIMVGILVALEGARIIKALKTRNS